MKHSTWLRGHGLLAFGSLGRGGGRARALWILGEKETQMGERQMSPHLGLGCWAVHPRVEIPEDSVFPEVGPSLGDMGQGRAGASRKGQVLPEPGPFLASSGLSRGTGASFTSPTVTRCFPVNLGRGFAGSSTALACSSEAREPSFDFLFLDLRLLPGFLPSPLQ